MAHRAEQRSAAGGKVLGLPPGVDFARALAEGLLARYGGDDPLALARVTVWLPTARMRSRLVELLCDGTPRLLPRMRILPELASDPVLADQPPPEPVLGMELEVARLVEAWLAHEAPEQVRAPLAAAFDLARAALALAREMAGEGVAPGDLALPEGHELARHWQTNLTFLQIAFDYLERIGAPMLPEARQRLAARRLAALWATTPPDGPVILAGSTASRGQAGILAEAIAQLPQGLIVLPAFDFDLPADLYGRLGAGESPEHPQSRNALLLARLGTPPADVRPWVETPPADPARNALVSLALRPAPVTDAWLAEGPRLDGIADLPARMSLLEAPDPGSEARAIATIIRDALRTPGRTVALVTPDGTLARMVAAQLENRWGLIADDSAGRPLALTAPGVLVRRIAHALGRSLAPGALLALCKHPLVAARTRPRHMRLVHEAERVSGLLRGGPPAVDFDRLRDWAAELKGGLGAEAAEWVAWLARTLDGAEAAARAPLGDWLMRARTIMAALQAGPPGWAEASAGPAATADHEADRALEEELAALDAVADRRGEVDAGGFRAVLEGVLSARTVRPRAEAHPRIAILGTLEARSDHADLVILGGLNEGVWPAAPVADPWLNRQIRAAAGLAPPERRLGLSAHDFQLAAAAPQVVLSRTLRDATRPTVPSRWLNRLVTLLAGIGPEGENALKEMRDKGREWLDLAARLDTPAPHPAAPAPRPAPVPPRTTLPDRLSVTQVKTLVRDPYAIYARKVLRLEPLDPLDREPDALLRGEILHKVLELWVAERRDDPRLTLTAARLREIAREVIPDLAPWPAQRELWIARIDAMADWLAKREAERAGASAPVALETRGEVVLEELGLKLVGKADRIDRAEDGTLIIFDYKAGARPDDQAIAYGDRQLALEGAMALDGGFPDLGKAPKVELRYISLKPPPDDRNEAEVTELVYTKRGTDLRIDCGIDATWQEFIALMTHWLSGEAGFVARARIGEEDRFGSDYDHLSRYGEWAVSDRAERIALPERAGRRAEQQEG